MSNETIVAIRGYVGAAPTVFTNATDKDTGEVLSAKTTVVRVGVTPRYYSRSVNEFRDGQTAWYSVRTYGSLAAHVAVSVDKGTPVIARGRLVMRQYEDKSGLTRIEHVLLADSFGIDLTHGTAVFTKTSAMPLESVPGEPRYSADAMSSEADKQFTTCQQETAQDPAGVLEAVMS
ncbi:single-stranded DNA-binding protein [Arcanobacterium phocae]|uniref:single-stranded DNA-binding protein n=1 Tax=Arcanobacterium phocae TaxID=131112 RepID=UPI001C0EDD87|nr:single-stranded DNA-binding protein [Arcanobacterium phocae]